jgi:hypothetical protein
MKILHLLSIFLLAGSISAISDLNWNAHDEELVGGKTLGSSSIQLSIDNSERLANGVFDLYRILSSNNDRLNQIVSNVHQTVGKDTYSVNHVFKHIKNGNYYVEIDTDKYNFAINVVRMPISQHSHNADGSVRPATSRPSSTSVHQVEAKQTAIPPTTSEPGKQTTTGPAARPPTTSEPGKQTTTGPVARPPTTSEPGKQTTTGPAARPPTTSEPVKQTTTGPAARPPTTSEPGKQTTTGAARSPTTSEPGKQTTTGPAARPPTTSEPGKQTTDEPKTTATQQEIEQLRAQENKRFNQILGQWLFAGVKSTDLSSNYGYMACDMITIFTHGTQFYYKVLEYKGNGTFEMHDTHIESVDKKNSLFKMGSNVYSYKLQSLDGKNYKKVKILQITNLNNSSDVSLFTEQPVNSNVLGNVFSDHFANLQITKIEQVCNDD